MEDLQSDSVRLGRSIFPSFVVIDVTFRLLILLLEFAELYCNMGLLQKLPAFTHVARLFIFILNLFCAHLSSLVLRSFPYLPSKQAFLGILSLKHLIRDSELQTRESITSENDKKWPRRSAME